MSIQYLQVCSFCSDLNAFFYPFRFLSSFSLYVKNIPLKDVLSISCWLFKSSVVEIYQKTMHYRACEVAGISGWPSEPITRVQIPASPLPIRSRLNLLIVIFTIHIYNDNMVLDRFFIYINEQIEEMA